MADSRLRDLSTDFAVKIIKMCDGVKGHYSLVNQLERSSTSIGANIHEANYAHSKADFVAKFQIALKECYETGPYTAFGKLWNEKYHEVVLRKKRRVAKISKALQNTVHYND